MTRPVLEALGGIATVNRVVLAAIQRSPPRDLIHGQGGRKVARALESTAAVRRHSAAMRQHADRRVIADNEP